MNKSKGCLDWFSNCFKNKKQEEDFNKTKQDNQIITNFITPEKAIIKNSSNNMDKEYKLESIQPEELLIKKVNISKEINANNECIKSNNISKAEEMNKLQLEGSLCKRCNNMSKDTQTYNCCNQVICSECQKSVNQSNKCIFCSLDSKNEIHMNYLPLNQKETTITDRNDNKIISTVKEVKFSENEKEMNSNIVNLNENDQVEISQNLKIVNVNEKIFEYDKRSRSFDNGDYCKILDRKNHKTLLIYTLQGNVNQKIHDNKIKNLKNFDQKSDNFFETVKLQTGDKNNSKKLKSFKGQCGEEIKHENSNESIDHIIHNNEEFYFERDSVEF